MFHFNKYIMMFAGLVRKKNILILMLLVFIASGCATYYMKTIKVQENIMNGNMAAADKLMTDDVASAKNRNAILHNLNHGYIKFMMKDWPASNQKFEEADRLIADQQKNYAVEALSLLSNPMLKPYKPEDFEVVMLNYFTALNYINMGELDEALVVCKRINNTLNKLNDKYADKKNRYQRDAFANLLMGLLYDASHDYNNAFIAYRNAVDVYENDYVKNFGVSVPLQLQKDIIRTAYLTGFYDEVDAYQKKFKLTYEPASETDLVFIWMNGFGPIKDEWSINLTTVQGQGGNLLFVNEEMGLSFTFPLNNLSHDEQVAFSDFHMMRIAFPKYLERKPYYTVGTIENAAKSYRLEIAENINEIAFKTLNDRMMRELATSLLRLAAKKAMEELARKQNANAGALLGIVNALTEKADTRNWQTLPYSFSYTRVPLAAGDNSYKLKVNASNGATRSYDFNVQAQKGKTYFQSFHNVETQPF